MINMIFASRKQGTAASSGLGIIAARAGERGVRRRRTRRQINLHAGAGPGSLSVGIHRGPSEKTPMAKGRIRSRLELREQYDAAEAREREERDDGGDEDG